MTHIGLLLAAGASRRFGPDDKLLAVLHGKALVAHAAQAMRQTSLTRRISVICNPALSQWLEGFEIVMIQQGQQSDSLRAGLSAAGNPDRLLITLGDMPDITPDHLTRILNAATDTHPAASLSAGTPCPPACFPQSALPSLTALQGDRGAGALLRALPANQLILAPTLLRDVDTLQDLNPATVRKYPTGGCGGT